MKRAPEFQVRHRTAIVSGLVVLLCAAIGCRSSDDDLRFAVTFGDAGGIEKGDDVHYKGLEIGEVTAVGVDADGHVRVDVVVEAKYRDAITTSSQIEIERAGLLGGRQLTVRDGEGPRQALSPGAVLAGTLGPVEGAVDSLRSMSSQALESLQQRAGDLQRRLSEAREQSEDAGADSDSAGEAIERQLQELATSFAQLREEAERAADQDGEHAAGAEDSATNPELQQRMDAVREQMAELREKLERESADLRERLGPLLEDLEDWLRFEEK